MTDAILTINAGSSSIKFALFAIGGVRLVSGAIERIGEAPHFIAENPQGALLEDRCWRAGATMSHEALLDELLGWVDHHLGDARLVAAGHRIVHGGTRFAAPVRIDDAVMAALDRLCPLAPLHQPHNLAPVRAIARLRPGLPQIGCFDTGFHHALPPLATMFALPRRYWEAGVRRYGFHGLSYEYIARKLGPRAKGRVIVAHLGNGASLCAMRDGRSVDTTMGFTALDGLMMGTRCGTIDPGVVLYMMQEQKLAPGAIEHVLYNESGLLGVSGIGADMRALLASADPRAREAVDLFVRRIVREAGALVAMLGGLDRFVFTAGIGEHAAPIREAVQAGLGYLAGVEFVVVPTDEDAMIATHCREALGLEVLGMDAQPVA